MRGFFAFPGPQGDGIEPPQSRDHAMSYYSIESLRGTDFICIVRDHARRVRCELLVRATDEREARLAFRGERSLSLLTIRAK